MSQEYDPLVGSEVNLKDYLDILRRRKALFIQVFVVVLAAGIAVTAMTKPVYQTQAELKVANRQPHLWIQGGDNLLGPVLDIYQPDPLQTQLQEMRTGDILRTAYEETVRERPGILSPKVELAASDDTNIITVTVTGGDPQEIAKLANRIVELKLQDLKDQDVGGVKKMIALLEETRRQEETQATRAQGRLVALETAFPAQRKQLLQEAARSRTEARSRLQAAEFGVESTRMNVADLERRLRREPLQVEIPRQKDNPAYLREQAKLNALYEERQKLLDRYQSTSEPVLDVNERIQRQEQALTRIQPTLTVPVPVPNPARERMEKHLADAQEELNKYAAQLIAARAQVQSAPALPAVSGTADLEKAQLVHERDAAQAALIDVNKRLRDRTLRHQQFEKNSGHRRIQSAAAPPASSARGNTGTLVISVLAAFLLATLLTFAQEYLDDRINKPEDLDRITTLPGLAHVPMIPQDQPRLLTALPSNSHVAEAYRGLRSSIHFAALDAPIRRILITSPAKGEGKSITSVNLATVLAMEGKRVILIDTDLRKPSLHRLLDVPSDHGLAEVLAGLATVDEVLQETDVQNLQVVCSGPIPPNPAEMLGSSAFDDVIDALEERADVLVFDTTPCTPVTDPLVIARRMDGVVLVVHVSQTRKGCVKQALELLTRSRARLLGVVYNRARYPQGGYYGYYGYYGYGTYGPEEAEPVRRWGRREKRAAVRGERISAVTSGRRDRDDV